MKHFLIYFVFFIYVALVNGQQKIHQNFFVPDTSINNTVRLLDRKSILNTFGDLSGKLIIDEKESRIQFMNKEGTQYLILYHLEGGNTNSFNEFEVGYLKADNKNFKKPCLNIFLLLIK